jgi:hypothetical protein
MYTGTAGFLEAVVPFVEEGVALEQPVLVAVAGERLAALQTALGATATQVVFADMAELGRNPAQIIPAWLEFVAAHSAGGTPVRGVGEPIWAERTEPEIVECQFHEGLLNVAVAPDVPLWLICPYDVAALDASVIAEAHRSHPVLVEADHYRGSTAYGGAFHVQELFHGELPEPMGFAHAAPFSSTDVRQVQHWIEAAATDAGMSLGRARQLAAVVQQLAVDSIRYGNGRGALRHWTSGNTLICEITDPGVVTDPLVGRSTNLGGDTHRPGLWSANRVCDLVQVRSTKAGTTTRVHVQITAVARQTPPRPNPPPHHSTGTYQDGDN